MGGDDHIRIGNPSLNISDNQVFLKSDSINPGCDELALNQITLFLAGKKMFGARSNVVTQAIGEQVL